MALASAFTYESWLQHYEAKVQHHDWLAHSAAGGNSGIGYESGLKIAQAGGHVILAVRSDDKGEE